MLEFSKGNSYAEIMDRVMGHKLLEEYDKREGGVAFNTSAPFSLEVANICAMLDILSDQSYLSSASGDNLDRRAYDFGFSRLPATYAERIVTFEFEEDHEDTVVPIGTRFSVPLDASDEQVIFTYEGVKDNNLILKCETAGTVGNTYVGKVIAVDYVKHLEKATITGTYTLANDKESDDAFRLRVEEGLTVKPFGGNIAQYTEVLKGMSGIGGCKIYPAWQGQGEVLCSIVDGVYDPVPQNIIAAVKEELDPVDKEGEGVGLAPIGHTVTVTTPERYTCDVYAVVALKGGLILDEVKPELVELLENYFLYLRSTFAQDVIISVFRARLSETLLQSPSLLNVDNVMINGFAADLTMPDSPTISGEYLPYLGEVTFEQAD